MVRSFLTIAIAALSLACAIPVAAQSIGTVASVEPSMRGTPPGGGARRLDLGTQVVTDETIQTDGIGRGQILFRDQSTLAIGPNTTIVLDTFVFDPATGDGQMGLRMTEGVLRFIGGTLSERTPATIALPGATIGIRGSTGLFMVINGEPIAVFLSGGQMCLTSDTTSACTSRRGGVLTQDGYAGPINPGFLNSLLGLLDSSLALDALSSGAINQLAEQAFPEIDGALTSQVGDTVVLDLDRFFLDFTADELIDLLTSPGPSNSGGTGGTSVTSPILIICPPGTVLDPTTALCT